MKIHNLILIYTAMLMILSQTPWAKSVVFLAILLLILLIFRHTRINQFGFKKILFLNLIIVLGFISGIIHLVNYDLYLFTRDIIYFIQAPIFIIIGIYLYKDIKDLKILLKIIIVTSFGITIYKLSEFIVDPSLIFRLGLETRYKVDLSNSTALLTFIVMFYSRKFQYKLFSNNIELFIMSLSLFSIAVSFSRTMYIILLITLSILYIKNRKTILYMYGISVFLVLFVIFGGNFIEEKANGIEYYTFQSKMMHSLTEITIRQYTHIVDINANWRGYEAYLGLSKYYQGNLLEFLFGQGYGAVVQTPFWIFKGEKLNLLPIFHNGYITIILKTGLIGLIFFFLFLYNLLQIAINVVKTAINDQEKLLGKLLQASVFIIFFQTFVIHGIFQTTAPFLLLLLIGVILHNISVNRSIKK